MTEQWQPIDTAPRDGTKILAYGPGVDGWTWPADAPKPAQMSVCQWTEYGDEEEEAIGGGLYKKVKRPALGAWRGTSLSWFEPTHWMPLPEPPGMEDQTHEP